MSPSTTRRMFSAGPTVSMCAERRNGAAPGAVPVKRARMLPVSPPMQGIGESMVRAGKEAELTRLPGAVEEKTGVGRRHHVIALALHHQHVARPPRGLPATALTHFRHQRGTRRRHVI